MGRQQYDLGHIARVAELMDYAKRAEASGRKPLIVDAGANIGAASIFFAAKMPGARIVAIEPDQENFQLLCRSVEGLGVETINAAVSSTTGRARVVDPGRGPWAYRTQSVADDDTATGAVPRITINDIFQAHAAEAYPFIIKIDIEGAEADLFSGNTEWVARNPLIIVELHDWLLPKRRRRGRSCNASRSSNATSSILAKMFIRSPTISTPLRKPVADVPVTRFRMG